MYNFKFKVRDETARTMYDSSLHHNPQRIQEFHDEIRLKRLGEDFDTERTVIPHLSTLKELKLERIELWGFHVGDFLNSYIFNIGEAIEITVLYRLIVSKKDNIEGSYYPLAITEELKKEILLYRKKMGKKIKNVSNHVLHYMLRQLKFI